MPFYIKKSAKIGLFRFNLSKSGIGTSVGVKGFRVGVRPDGSSYMHAGRNGLYFREELGSSKNFHEISDGNACDMLDNDKNLDVRVFSSPGKKVLIEEIEKINKFWRRDLIALSMLVLSLLILFNLAFEYKNLLLPLAGILGAIVVFFIHKAEVKRRLINIEYEFEDNSVFCNKVINAFDMIKRCLDIKAEKLSGPLVELCERKRNSTIISTLDTRFVNLYEALPQCVKSNILFQCVDINGMKLYFMPDGVLVDCFGKWAALEYKDVVVSSNYKSHCPLDSPPADTVIIQRSWRHSNSDGSPDLRFKNNRQFIVCRYGELTISSPKVFSATILLSNGEAAMRFGRCFNK